VEAIAPVIFNTQREEECLSCISEKSIIEFAIIAETIIPRIRNFRVNLWWFSFSSTVR
jgi:hypothetical protein